MKSMGRFPGNSTGSTVVEEWRVVDAIPDSNVVIYGRLEHFKSDQENPGYVCCWGMEYGSQLHGYFNKPQQGFERCEYFRPKSLAN